MAGAPNQIAWTVESCSNSPLDEWRIHGPAVGAARSDDSFSPCVALFCRDPGIAGFILCSPTGCASFQR